MDSEENQTWKPRLDAVDVLENCSAHLPDPIPEELPCRSQDDRTIRSAVRFHGSSTRLFMMRVRGQMKTST